MSPSCQTRLRVKRDEFRVAFVPLLSFLNGDEQKLPRGGQGQIRLADLPIQGALPYLRPRFSPYFGSFPVSVGADFTVPQ